MPHNRVFSCRGATATVSVELSRWDDVLSAPCEPQVAVLQADLHTAQKSSDEINEMAQSQLGEAAQAMRKMKQHVEQLARTKRDYESTIEDLSDKLSAAEKANLASRQQQLTNGTDSEVTNDLEEARAEVQFLRWGPLQRLTSLK